MSQKYWENPFTSKDDEPYSLFDDNTENEVSEDSFSLFDDETKAPQEVDNPYADLETPVYVVKNESVATVKEKTKHFCWCTILLILANVIAGGLCLEAGKDHVLSGGINYEYIKIHKEYGRYISYMFLHVNSSHLFNNMIALGLFGLTVEKKLGSLRMAIIYFGSGIGAGIFSANMSHWMNPDTFRFAVGASGAVFGIMCASIFLDIKGSGKTKRSDMFVAIGLIVIYALISMSAHVDIYGHIGGAIIGGILTFALNVNKWEGFKENLYAKLIGILITVWFCIMGIGEADIGKDAKALPDERIDYIQEQRIFASDDITYGEGLEYYCTDTSWHGFTSTDGDEVVEFNGETYYNGKHLHITMQFIINGDFEDFYICYFAFDDNSQNGTVVNDYFTLLCTRYKADKQQY